MTNYDNGTEQIDFQKVREFIEEQRRRENPRYDARQYVQEKLRDGKDYLPR